MNLTPEQIEEMVSESADLVFNRKPWIGLSARQQEVFRWLMPDRSFTDEQRNWLSKWVLEVSQEQLDTCNALMPPGNLIEPRAAEDGTLYIGADLLSDALDGRRLSALLPILETLLLTYADMIIWPNPESEQSNG